MTYAAHFLIGLCGAGAGWYGRQYCPHRRHQIFVTLWLVAAESILSVRLIG